MLSSRYRACWTSWLFQMRSPNRAPPACWPAEAEACTESLAVPAAYAATRGAWAPPPGLNGRRRGRVPICAARRSRRLAVIEETPAAAPGQAAHVDRLLHAGVVTAVLRGTTSSPLTRKFPGASPIFENYVGRRGHLSSLPRSCAR